MSNLILGITSIGDLLLRETITQQITEKGESNIISNVHLHIPIYQRPYKWTARNALQLLNDIVEAMNKNKETYRVGTLILYHHNQKQTTKVADGDSCSYDIVDGLQRVITFSLLLKALGESKDSIPFLEQQLYINDFNKHNIANNYNALYRRVGQRNEETGKGYEFDNYIDRLKDYIESQCEMIVVITQDLSEAFQFFDSQNARGKTLYPHDLLKAYHLREMRNVSESETEKTVAEWEQVEQQKLAGFFGDYLYRIKEWVSGNKAQVLNEQNIQMFKGITRMSRTPYAQFYKGAYSYAEMVNSSAMPFVSGTRDINAFQLNAPIIAGKPFFEYTKHYYTILSDIRNNDKYEGFYINDNEIVKTLDNYFNNGVGNGITRLLFDTSVLLYVDRFCPKEFPEKSDLELFNQFVEFAFVWAYSLRAQYTNLGWLSAQNYIMGAGYSNKINAFNIYRLIIEQDTPEALLGALTDKLSPLSHNDIGDNNARKCRECSNVDKTLAEMKDQNNVYENYLYYFQINGYFKS